MKCLSTIFELDGGVFLDVVFTEVVRKSLIAPCLQQFNLRRRPCVKLNRPKIKQPPWNGETLLQIRMNLSTLLTNQNPVVD